MIWFPNKVKIFKLCLLFKDISESCCWDYHKMLTGLFFSLLLCGLMVENVLGFPPIHCTVDFCIGCPRGWYLRETSCYRFEGTEKNWSDAEQFCVSLSAHLASMEKPWDRDAIQAVIYSSAGTRAGSWVGGTDAGGAWTWSDGSPFTFTAWGPGEPNNSGGDEHCMEINLNGADSVGDVNCNGENPFVCAKDATVL